MLYVCFDFSIFFYYYMSASFLMCIDSFNVIVGYVGGSHYSHSGGAVEPLCLPRNPEWGIYKDGTKGGKAYVYGAEYETSELTRYMRKLHDHDVPCAVCLRRNKSAVKMFPGKQTINTCK